MVLSSLKVQGDDNNGGIATITVMDIPKVSGGADVADGDFLCHENSEKASVEDCYYARS